LFLGGRVREQVKSLCAGSTRDFLNQTILNSIEFPIPSIEEQNQIVQEIETRLSVCDKLNEAIDQSLEKAQALRQSILKKAFEGKLLSQDEIQNCRQQPDWEPAAKLLERVKKDSKTMKS
jgi:type I restriction enzyme S subunit